MGDVAAFYARGLERDRLESGAGALEFARTTMLLERLLPRPRHQLPISVAVPDGMRPG